MTTEQNVNQLFCQALFSSLFLTYTHPHPFPLSLSLSLSLSPSLYLSPSLSLAPPSGAPHSNSSTSLQSERSVSGAGLPGFGGSKDGMHQRSFSVSSAEQWSEAVINTSITSS